MILIVKDNSDDPYSKRLDVKDNSVDSYCKRQQ